MDADADTEFLQQLAEGERLRKRFAPRPRGWHFRVLEPGTPTRPFSLPFSKVEQPIVEVWQREKAVCRWSFGVFSIHSWFRQVVLQLVEAKWFDRFILTLVLVNSLMLLGYQHRDPDNAYNLFYDDIADNIFMGCFVTEMVLKTIAWGLIWDEHSYLRDAWNWLDFVVATTGLASVVDLGGQTIGTVRVFRVLRPLRSLHRFPQMRLIIKTVLRALPRLLEVSVMAIFFYSILAIMGLTLWQGIFFRQCRVQENPSLHPNGTCWLWEGTGEERLCGGSYMCDQGGFCGGHIFDRIEGLRPVFEGGHRDLPWCDGLRPIDEPPKVVASTDFIHFDNIGGASLVVFQSMTLEGWVDILYMVQDGSNWWIPTIYFLMLIFCTSFFLLNIFLAVIQESYELQAEEEKEKKRIQEGHESFDEGDGTQSQAHRLSWSKLGDDTDAATPDIISDTSEPEERGICACIMGFFAPIAESELFVSLIMLAIFLNTITMSLEMHPPLPRDFQEVLRKFEIAFLIIFSCEMVVMLLAKGLCGYIKDPITLVDGFVVLLSIGELVFPMGDDTGGSNPFLAIRGFRLLRILVKIANRFPSFRVLLTSIIKTVVALAEYFVLFVILWYVFTLTFMSVFANRFDFTDESHRTRVEDGHEPYCSDGVPESEWCIPRSHFDTIVPAVVTIFSIMTGENWNAVMYDGMRSGWINAVFFFILIVFGQILTLNLFLTILIEKFMTELVNVKKGEEDQKRRKKLKAQASAAHFPDKKSERFARFYVGMMKPLANNALHKVGTFMSSEEDDDDADELGKQLSQRGPLRISELSSVAHGMSDLSLTRTPPDIPPPPEPIDSEVSAPTAAPGGDFSDDGQHLDEDAVILKEATILPGQTGVFTMTCNTGGSQDSLAGPCGTPNNTPARRPLADHHQSAPDILPKKFEVDDSAPVQATTSELDIDSDLRGAFKTLAVEQEDDDEWDMGPLPSRASRPRAGSMTSQRSIGSDLSKSITLYRLHSATPSTWPRNYSCLLFSKHGCVRSFCTQIMLNKHFDNIILVCIGFSSLCMMYKTPLRNPADADIVFVTIADQAFAIIFMLEMVIKMIALGAVCARQSYFKSPWNWLDSAVVMVSVVDLLNLGETGFIKTLRVLRALRPLRAVARNPNLKAIVNTIFASLPNLSNLLLVCMLVLLILAILGTQLFSGRFYACEGPDGDASTMVLGVNAPSGFTTPMCLSNLVNVSMCAAGAAVSNVTGGTPHWVDAECSEDMCDSPDATLAWRRPSVDTPICVGRCDPLHKGDKPAPESLCPAALTRAEQLPPACDDLSRTLTLDEMTGLHYMAAMTRTLVLPCSGPTGGCREAFCPTGVDADKVAWCEYECGDHPTFCRKVCKTGSDSAECQECRAECRAWCECDHYCEPLALDAALCVEQGGRWTQQLSQNFDNVFNALLTLFEISTTEGWIDVMNAAFDSGGAYEQPRREANLGGPVFFVAYIFLSNMFLINLSVGVIVGTFIKMKPRSRLSEAQLRWVNSLKNLYGRSHFFLVKNLDELTDLRAQVFWFVSHKWFERCVMFSILINACFMGAQIFPEPSDNWSGALSVANLIFTLAYCLEFMMKFFAYRWAYFREPWNVFDFCCVVIALVGVMAARLAHVTVGGIIFMLRFLRVFRLTRLFRLIRFFKGLNKIFMGLVLSLPGLANVGLLLGLMLVLYSILGVQLFAKTKFAETLDDHGNFRNIFHSFLTVFRCMTGEAWNEIMHDLSRNGRDYGRAGEWCTPPLLFDTDDADTFKVLVDKCLIDNPNGCGEYMLPYAPQIFFVTYTLLMAFVMSNLVITVILDGYTEGSRTIAEADVIDDCVKVWKKYDPYQTEFLDLKSAFSFIDEVVNLQAGKPVEARMKVMPLFYCEEYEVLDLAKVPMRLANALVGNMQVTWDGRVHIIHAVPVVLRIVFAGKDLDVMREIDESENLLDHRVRVKLIKRRESRFEQIDEMVKDRGGVLSMKQHVAASKIQRMFKDARERTEQAALEKRERIEREKAERRLLEEAARRLLQDPVFALAGCDGDSEHSTNSLLIDEGWAWKCENTVALASVNEKPVNGDPAESRLSKTLHVPYPDGKGQGEVANLRLAASIDSDQARVPCTMNHTTVQDEALVPRIAG